MTTTAPPTPAEVSTRRDRMRAPVLVIGGLAVATLALRLRDPHEHGSWGLCPSAALGIYCPGCGGLRAVNDLTHGDLYGAASSNLLFIAVLPLLVFLLGRWAVDRWRGPVREPNARLITATTVTFCVIGVLFAVLRNLPGSWLAP